MGQNAVTAIAGLPGSGKTSLMKEMETENCFHLDDFNHHGKWDSWEDAVRRVKDAVQAGKSVVVSDITFWKSEDRLRLEHALDPIPVRWIFMEPRPLECMVNSVLRYFHDSGQQSRPLDRELLNIYFGSKNYEIPEGAERYCGGLHRDFVETKCDFPKELS